MNDNARPNEVETGAVMNMPGRQSHDTASQRQNVALQLRRRRQASLRCEPLQDGRRDPWSSAGEDRRDYTSLMSWARALAHLRDVGLVGLPPAEIREALAARGWAA